MDWKFQIGDPVVTHAMMLENKAMAEIEHELRWLTPLRIIERVAVEYIAGMQCFYRVEVHERQMMVTEESLLPIDHYYDQQLALYEKIRAAKKAS